MTDLRSYAAVIDHSSLLPTDNRQIIEKECAEAVENGYACICITPATLDWVTAYTRQQGSDINISAAIAFPHGTTTAAVKVFEAVESCRKGANEIDMVMSVNRAKDGDWLFVRDEIAEIKSEMMKVRNDAVLKVIVETCLLSEEEKIKACEACIAAGADYIKTSTGFSSGGATVEDIRLFSDLSKGKIKVKASGGIKTADQFLAMINAGATRIGTKFSQAILDELSKRS